MDSFFIKFILKTMYWLATRLRRFGVRDWLASSAAVLLLAAMWVGPRAWALIGNAGSARMLDVTLFIVELIAVGLISWIPLSYVLKLRRLGITDADFSVGSGIDYAAALRSAKDGFFFSGVSGSKLKDAESDFRSAVKRCTQHGGKIQMLLLDPQSPAYRKLEEIDSTTAYAVKAQGSVSFFSELQRSNSSLTLRFYDAEDPRHMKPFRIFLTTEDCLLSPFVQGNGEGDQGRGLPQVRITSKGFPGETSPTLYAALRQYFDISWDAAAGDLKRG